MIMTMMQGHNFIRDICLAELQFDKGEVASSKQRMAASHSTLSIVYLQRMKEAEKRKLIEQLTLTAWEEPECTHFEEAIIKNIPSWSRLNHDWLDM